MDMRIGYTDGASFVPFKHYTDIAQFVTEPVKSRSTDNKMPIRGFSYGYLANRSELRSPAGIRSQAALFSLGLNWICLSVVNYQSTYSSTDLHPDYYTTPTDWDIAAFAEHARQHGLKVCLKPMVNPSDGLWRAHISFPDLQTNDMDKYWEEWFESYTHFILHYAALARELNFEMLCIGCEMIGTEHRSKNWLKLIEEVRAIYPGKLIYSTNHDREDVYAWFDELDYVGISAYYAVGANGSTKEDMIKAWTEIKYKLDAIAEMRNKQFLFTEIGCRSATGCAATPYDYADEGEWNEDEQANFYESCLEVFKDDKKFAGAFWWDWPTFTYETREEAEKDVSFNIHLKKAEEVIKKYYK